MRLRGTRLGRLVWAWTALATLLHAGPYEDHLERAQAVAESDRAAAIAALDSAVKVDRGRHEAHAMKAILQATGGDRGAALETLVRARVYCQNAFGGCPSVTVLELSQVRKTLAPETVEAEADDAEEAARAADADGLLFAAAQDYRRAFELDPARAALGLRAAAILVSIEETKAALRLLRQLEAYASGATLESVGELREKLAPLVATLHDESYQAAVQAHGAGEAAQALVHVDEALTYMPKSGRAHFLHARIQAKAERIPAALAAAKRAIKHGYRDRSAWLSERDLWSLTRTEGFRQLLRGVWGAKVLRDLEQRPWVVAEQKKEAAAVAARKRREAERRRQAEETRRLAERAAEEARRRAKAEAARKAAKEKRRVDEARRRRARQEAKERAAREAAAEEKRRQARAEAALRTPCSLALMLPEAERSSGKGTFASASSAVVVDDVVVVGESISDYRKEGTVALLQLPEAGTYEPGTAVAAQRMQEISGNERLARISVGERHWVVTGTLAAYQVVRRRDGPHLVQVRAPARPPRVHNLVGAGLFGDPKVFVAVYADELLVADLGRPGKPVTVSLPFEAADSKWGGPGGGIVGDTLILAERRKLPRPGSPNSTDVRYRFHQGRLLRERSGAIRWKMLATSEDLPRSHAVKHLVVSRGHVFAGIWAGGQKAPFVLRLENSPSGSLRGVRVAASSPGREWTELFSMASAGSRVFTRARAWRVQAGGALAVDRLYKEPVGHHQYSETYAFSDGERVVIPVKGKTRDVPIARLHCP